MFLFTYRFAARIAHVLDELRQIGSVLVNADALVGFLIIVAELADFQMSIVSAPSHLARGLWIGVTKEKHHRLCHKKISPYTFLSMPFFFPRITREEGKK